MPRHLFLPVVSMLLVLLVSCISGFSALPLTQEYIPFADLSRTQRIIRSNNRGVLRDVVKAGIIHEIGYQGYANYPAALKAYKSAAQRGNAFAIAKMGTFIEAGKTLKLEDGQPNLQLALAKYRESASKNDAFGMFQLGRVYQNGIGVKADLVEAKKWYLMSAERGDIRSNYELGMMESDPTLAYNMFLSAAKKGHAPSQVKVGLMNENGLGTAENMNRAIFWYANAARGDGGMYAARAMLEKLATDGNLKAQLRLYDMYRDKWLPGMKESEAFRYLRMAAKQGHYMSQIKMAELNVGVNPHAVQDYLVQFALAQNER